METAIKETKETGTKAVKTGWAKWGSRFYAFLTMGGFLVILVVIVGILMAISILCHKPEVTILGPKANYVAKAGDSYEILWKTELAESEFGAMVTLEFSKDGGKSWEKIEENVPNSGKYMWKVPKVDSTQCKVRISSKSKPGRYRGTSEVFSVK
jgi:hypothetical protein